MKKITLATVKKFIRENKDKLFINLMSDFDGMTDCVESRNDGFTKAEFKNEHVDQTLGISKAWFVGSSRDYFTAYDENEFVGIKVYNSCGSFVLAIKKSK